MDTQLKYMPILRGRQQEMIVLKSFDFQERIYPCLEIIKELDRLPPRRKKKSGKVVKIVPTKKFEDVYIPLIQEIKARKVFVDFPVHLKELKGMKPETLNFLRTVVARRNIRTEYMKMFLPLAAKVIPVISSYHNRTGENGSIVLQSQDLNPLFPSIAYRTFVDSFFRDIDQIQSVIRESDYIIVDWENIDLDLEDEDQKEMIEKLATFKCTIVIHKSSISKDITNVGLIHNEVVTSIDNRLLEIYRNFSGSCFSDYSGIKKDDISGGGTISPGFIYYDAVENQFYGYKGQIKDLDEFKSTIVPAIISSESTKRMESSASDYLGVQNVGWKMIKRIYNSQESGKSAAKFKRIGMEHYLHCLQIKIQKGDLD